jgi:hypothetical protein
LEIAALLVRFGACVQPFCSVSTVKPWTFLANETPSSEVKHCASENDPFALALTVPVGSMMRRPALPSHMSTGTMTLLSGRNAAGSVKAWPVVPPAIAPLRRMVFNHTRAAPAFRVPKLVSVQPLSSASSV